MGSEWQKATEIHLAASKIVISNDWLDSAPYTLEVSVPSHVLRQFVESDDRLEPATYALNEGVIAHIQNVNEYPKNLNLKEIRARETAHGLEIELDVTNRGETKIFTERISYRGDYTVFWTEEIPL